VSEILVDDRTGVELFVRWWAITPIEYIGGTRFELQGAWITEAGQRPLPL
jgi:hypothetical protein